MVYLIAGVLLGAAILILTLPWSRHDPADLSLVELGYVWRGPRGAVAGALRVLHDQGVVKRIHGGMERKTRQLTRGADPFVRAVFAGLDVPRGPAALLDLPGVEEKLPPVAERVMAARLRVGPARRAVGSVAAVAPPVMGMVALGHGVGPIAVGIVTVVVSVVVAAWLGSLRGITTAGLRTLATAPSLRRRRRGAAKLSHVTSISGLWLATSGATDGGFGVVTGDSGSHHGGHDGGGGDGGGY
jgi:uncharacterized protein (TIGR04222 family)